MEKCIELDVATPRRLKITDHNDFHQSVASWFHTIATPPFYESETSMSV
jgi:hypothetical protein